MPFHCQLETFEDKQTSFRQTWVHLIWFLSTQILIFSSEHFSHINGAFSAIFIATACSILPWVVLLSLFEITLGATKLFKGWFTQAAFDVCGWGRRVRAKKSKISYLSCSKGTVYCSHMHQTQLVWISLKLWSTDMIKGQQLWHSG